MAFGLILKPIRYCDLETGKEKRRSEVTENGLMRSMTDARMGNRLKFRRVLSDAWSGSAENMRRMKLACGREFTGALKSDRLVALSGEDRLRGRFIRADQIGWQEQEAAAGRPKVPDFPVRLTRQVFADRDGSTGIRHLARSDLAADWNTATAICKKRRNAEVFHKSLKSDASMSKSPARPVNAQKNHIFTSIAAVFEMERLKTRTKLNHFALRSKLCLKAVRSACNELHRLRAA